MMFFDVTKIGQTSIGEHTDLLEQVAYCARVSSQRKNKFDDHLKLCKFMLKNGHWSPFEMVNISFEITTTRAMAREILRHKTMPPQEFSQRYAEVLKIIYPEFRLKGASNRQSSLPLDNPTEEQQSFIDEVYRHLDQGMELYKRGVALGFANETIRYILPECAQTQLIVNGCLRSWITFLNVRLPDTAQLEIRAIARRIAEMLIFMCPGLGRITNNFNDFKGDFCKIDFNSSV